MRALIALCLAATLAIPAIAHDWTGMDDPVLAGWFMSLRRKLDNMSCCGLGDAYMVVITKMPDPYQAESGEFEITDGRALEVEGVKRPAIPEGTVFRFSHLHFTNEKSGNPTPSAWAFINSNGVVYCVVPLPPSF